VQGNHLGERNTGAPSRKSRAPKQIAASAVLIACVLAGVLGLAAAQASSSEAAAQLGSAQTPIGATIFQDDFELGDLSKWTSFSSSGFVAQQVNVFAGLWAAEATATGGAGAFAYKDLTQTETNLWYETRFNILSHTTNVNLLRFRNNLGAHNALATLFVSTTNKLGLRNDVTGVQTTSVTTSVTLNTWHLAQVYVTINGTSSSTAVWLDGTPVASLSQAGINLNTNPIGRLELGDPTAARTFDVAFDNVVAVPDSTAPSAPLSLHTTSVASNAIALAWGAASDDVGVTGYRIFRNGSATPIASVGATTTSYSNTGLTPGTTYSYTVKAVDAAGNISAASATATATTAKLNQTITFGALADKRYGNADFNVSATASSGLTVSFTASGNCTVSGSTVHLTGPGSCTVTASQPGNSTYNAAPVVSQTFSIAKKIVPLKCRVPKVVRKGLKAAKVTIKRRHCRTGKVRYAYSRTRKKGIVISQSRRPGRVLPAKSKINLVVSRGRKR
jgi:Fibronectin type III domain/PASTA domain